MPLRICERKSKDQRHNARLSEAAKSERCCLFKIGYAIIQRWKNQKGTTDNLDWNRGLVTVNRKVEKDEFSI